MDNFVQLSKTRKRIVVWVAVVVDKRARLPVYLTDRDFLSWERSGPQESIWRWYSRTEINRRIILLRVQSLSLTHY